MIFHPLVSPVLTVAVLCAPAAAQEQALPPHITAIFDAYTALPDVLLPPLQAAKDKASADAAAPQLKAAMEKLYDARTQMQMLTSLSPEEKAAVEKRYGLKMRQQWGKVYEEMFRIQKAKCFGSPEFGKLYSIMGLMLGK